MGLILKPFYNPDADFTEMDKENEKLNGMEINKTYSIKFVKKVAVIEDKNIQ